MTENQQPPSSYKVQPVEHKNRDNDRISVANYVYFRNMRHDAQGIEVRYSKMLQSVDGEHYDRRVKIGEDWKPLDLGYFSDNPKNVGTIVIHNEEGRFIHVKPSEAEMKLVESKVLEISYKDCTGGWLIPPGECFHGCPVSPEQLCIRSQSGICTARLFIIPR